MAIRAACLIHKGLPCINVLESRFNIKVQSRGVTDDTSEPISHIPESPAAENHPVKTSEQSDGLPEEPTNCCMSGCANCVWIKYAEELMNSFEGGSDMARQVIMDKVQDPNMKAFLNMELRTMGK